MEQLVIQHAALVVVDFQEGILRVPFAPYTASAVLENGVRLSQRFREVSAPVVLTRHCDYQAPVERVSRH